jgi:hypothetical protein
MKKLTLIFTAIMVVTFVLSGSAFGAPKWKPSDAYLSGSEFVYEYGPATLIFKIDLAKKGVAYALTGVYKDPTGIGDNFPLDVASGAAMHPVFNSVPSDLSAYGKVELEFQNLGPDDVSVNVFMNTGFTGPGNCGGGPACDTFWENGWTLIQAGKKKKVKLDFKKAIAWNISDDPVNTGLVDGNTYAIFRLDEVTNFGFQVADFTADPSDSTDVVDVLLFIRAK